MHATCHTFRLSGRPQKARFRTDVLQASRRGGRPLMNRSHDLFRISSRSLVKVVKARPQWGRVHPKELLTYCSAQHQHPLLSHSSRSKPLAFASYLWLPTGELARPWSSVSSPGCVSLLVSVSSRLQTSPNFRRCLTAISRRTALEVTVLCPSLCHYGWQPAKC